jgi:hypothetical protein
MLPAETQRLWERLQDEPLLRGAVLVGGTALTLRIQHRRSDDLDFLYTSMRLPGEALTLCVEKLRGEGWRLERDDDPAALEDFEIAGMELHDHQQDFIANGSTVLTFFTGDAAAQKLLTSPPRTDGPRLAEVREIFALKCVLSAQRSKSRDWFDLFILIERHGFTATDFLQAFAGAQQPTSIDSALTRLCAPGTPADDEGIAGLAEAVPSIEEMKARFLLLRDECELLRARDAFAHES